MRLRPLFSAFLCSAFFCSMLLFSAASAVAEDITIVSNVSSKKSKPRTSTQYFTETKIRTADGSSDTIFDYQASKMIFIEHKKKEYWTTTPEEVQAAFADLKAMLEDNPILRRMFGRGAEVSVEKTGKTREIAGHRCNEYLATMGKAYEFEICAAPELVAPIHYHQARRVFYSTMGPMAGRLETLLEEMEKIEGLPLATTFRTKLMGRTFETFSEAIEVRLGPVPDDAFEVPASYKQKKSPYQQK